MKRFGVFVVLFMFLVEVLVMEVEFVFDELELDGVVFLLSYLDGIYLGDLKFDVVMVVLD